MDPKAQEAIAPALFPGESLVWAGRPQSGIKFRPFDAFLIPLGVVWCVFVAGAFVASLRGTAPLVFAVVPVFMLLFGLYFFLGRLVVEAYHRQNTFYGVTNERIVIVYGVLTRRVKSFMIKTLNDVSLVENRSGAGTITFGSSLPWNIEIWMSFPGFQEVRPAFEYLDDARSVYALIRNTHAKAS